MNRTKKALTILLLSLTALSLFAQGTSEKVNSFSSLDFSNVSISEIEKSYEDAKKSYESSLKSLETKLEKAYEERDVDEYIKVSNLMDALEYPVVSKEITDTLLERLLNSTSDEEKSETASFLYENSRYYSPSLTLYASYETEYGKKTYSKTIKVEPGETITLPSDTSFSGSLVKGWSIDKENVLYEPGEEIVMPYTDTVLYAVLTSGISFEDDVTGYSYVTEETSASVPTLDAPDSSYVFAGWYDTSSGKLLEDESVTVEEGKSRSYRALWKSIKVEDGKVKYYPSGVVPSSTQLLYTAVLDISGNSRLSGVTVTLEENDNIKVLSGDKYYRSLKSGDEIPLSFAVVLSGESGETVETTITVKDSDGNVWETPVTFTIK